MAQVILDKSYLQGAKTEQIRSLCKEHTVLMPWVLFYEILTTTEASRRNCFNKFPDVNNPVELIGSVGNLLQYELDNHQPCTPLYDRREKKVYKFHNGLRTGTFQFPNKEISTKINNHQESVKRNTRSFFELAMMVYEFFPHLSGMPYSHFPKAVQQAKQVVASNGDKVRDIYDKLLLYAPPNAISAASLDPNWAYFRWIQVRVIYSLDLLLIYQGRLPPVISNGFWQRIEHEMLDAEYVILASLAGALACNETKIIETYLSVRPDGLLVTYKR